MREEFKNFRLGEALKSIRDKFNSLMRSNSLEVCT